MRRRLLAGALLATLLAGCVGTTPTPTTSASPAVSGSPSGSAGSPSASSASAAPTTYPFTLAGMPRIDGSTANIPLISLTIQRLTGVPATEADNAVKTTGTPNAWRNLVSGDTDLLIVYEADGIVKAEIKESGVKLEAHPIGRDALVFFTNSSNPVKSLTTAQYRAIYTGKIGNWSAVGGEDAKIVAYQRPEESGSQALLRKYVVGKDKMAKAPSEMITAEMGEIIDDVASYANTGNALGYSVYYYLANMYDVEGIKMLGAGGVMPSRDTLGDGSYPYTNDFFAVVRSDAPADSPARKVLAWLTSDAGRQTVEDAGYVAAK
jgi:phosphate transport system substrate-binding protein